MSVDLTEVTNIYNTLDGLVSNTLDGYFTAHTLTSVDKATIMSQAVTTLINASVQSHIQANLSTAQKLKIEKETEIAEISRYVADATKTDKITKSTTEKDIVVATKQDKIDLAKNTADNVLAQANLTTERQTQLINSVIYNNYSKALDYFSQAYGLHKSGGGTITTSMWLPPLEIAKALATSNTAYNFTFAPSTITIVE